MTSTDALLPLLKAQRSGWSLSRPFYSDPAVFEADLEHIWLF